MTTPGTIRYLHQSEIDKTKWDQLIDRSENGLVYGYSFYLDSMSPGWEALVLDDYLAVMPLTFRKKYGIRYLYQPFLTAQLGVFGNELTETIVESFIHAIPGKFKLIEISMNEGNVFDNPTGSHKLFPLASLRKNYLLPLQSNYETLQSNFRDNIRRNIKKSTQAGNIIRKDIDVAEVIRLATAQMHTFSGESVENVTRFRELYNSILAKKMAITYGVYSAAEKLLASCVFFFSYKRAYYILVGNDPAGKDSGASHALIDAFIRDHAGQDMLLDFEGSDIESLAFFYSSFGAVEKKYPAIRINRLPFFLKWLK